MTSAITGLSVSNLLDPLESKEEPEAEGAPEAKAREEREREREATGTSILQTGLKLLAPARVRGHTGSCKNIGS